MANEFDDITVVHISAGDDEGADITLEYNATRITVSVFASPSSEAGQSSSPESPLENRVLRLLNKAVIADDEDYDDLINETLDEILGVGESSFSQVAPRIRQPRPAGQDLHSLLYPESLAFRLQTVEGKATVFQISPEEGLCLPDAPPEPRLDTAFQPDDQLFCYSAKDLVVQDVFVEGNGIVGRVYVAGRDMLCKARRVGLWDSGLERELTTLQNIQATVANTGLAIRVPRLHGYVTHADSGAVIGLLREWIPSSFHGKTLRDVNVSLVPLNIRQKWADQIRQTMVNLHSIGIVWGDGKPSNIIINQSEDIELIDFAGGWSQGWVDEQLAETIEGDVQALGRIEQFLGV